MEFYDEDKVCPESSVVGAEEVGNDGVEIDVPIPNNHPVGATYVDNFMREVQNLNPQ